MKRQKWDLVFPNFQLCFTTVYPTQLCGIAGNLEGQEMYVTSCKHVVTSSILMNSWLRLSFRLEATLKNEAMKSWNFQIWVQKLLLLELFPFKYLTELPVWWSNIIRSECSSATGGHLKRYRLPLEIHIALPVLSPISSHRYPPSFWSFHFQSYHLTIQTHIGN